MLALDSAAMYENMSFFLFGERTKPALFALDLRNTHLCNLLWSSKEDLQMWVML